MLDFFPDLRQIRYNSFNNLKQEVNVRLFDEILLRFGCCFAIYIHRLRRCCRKILSSALKTLTFASHLLGKCFLNSLASCYLLWNICNHHGRSNPNHLSLLCNPTHSLRRHQLRLPLLLNISILTPGKRQPPPQMVSHRRGPGDLRRRSASSQHQNRKSRLPLRQQNFLHGNGCGPRLQSLFRTTTNKLPILLPRRKSHSISHHPQRQRRKPPQGLVDVIFRHSPR